MIKLLHKFTFVLLATLTAGSHAYGAFNIKNSLKKGLFAWQSQSKKAKWAQGAALASLAGGALLYYFKIHKPKKAAEYQVKKQNYRERIKNLIASDTQDNQAIIKLIEEYSADCYKNAHYNFYITTMGVSRNSYKNFKHFSAEMFEILSDSLKQKRLEIFEHYLPLMNDIIMTDYKFAADYYNGIVSNGTEIKWDLELLLIKARKHRAQNPDLYDYLLKQFCKEEFGYATVKNASLRYNPIKQTHELPLKQPNFIKKLIQKQQEKRTPLENVVVRYLYCPDGKQPLFTGNLLIFQDKKYQEKLIFFENTFLRSYRRIFTNTNAPDVTKNNLDKALMPQQEDNIINALVSWYLESASDERMIILEFAALLGHKKILQEAINKRTMYESTDAFDLNFKFL